MIGRMADRTFESQQYASQEAARGEAALSQGIGALAGAAGQAGAALERHGDRMAQREQAGAQMAESRRQADQSAGLRRDEMGLQREQMKQQGSQFDQQMQMSRERQTLDLRFRQQVEGRLVQGQLAEQEINRAKVMLDYQAHAASQAEFKMRFEQRAQELAVASQTKLMTAQTKAQEIQNEIAELQVKSLKEQQTGEYQRGRLAGRTIEQQMKLVDNLSSTWAKLSEAVSADPTLLKDVSERYKRESDRLQRLLNEEDSSRAKPDAGPPPPRRQAYESGTNPPPPVRGIREINYDRFDDIVTRSMIGSVRSPGNSAKLPNADPANAKVFSMLIREKSGGGGTEFVDQVAFQKWKQAASRMFVGMPEQGHDERSFIAAFNRQVDKLMSEGLSLHAALDHLGGAQ